MKRLLALVVPIVAALTPIAVDGAPRSTALPACTGGSIVWVNYGQPLTCVPKHNQHVAVRYMLSSLTLSQAHAWCAERGGEFVATRYAGTANVCVRPNPELLYGGAPSTSTTTTVALTTTTSTTVRPTTSTSPPSSTTTSTSSSTTTIAASSTTTSTIPPSSDPVADIGVGGALPSEATCAARVVSMSENRPGNATANNTRGSSPNDWYPRVTGNFVGTTDEILQWAACKWGIDPDWVRAQAIVESFWDQSGVPGDGGESFGILQVRRPYHQSAFEDENAVRSTAYNADYTFENWRRCFEGHPDYAWLNDVERGRQYAAGDGLGCMGVWYWGRWYTQPAVDYMNRVTEHYNARTWQQSWFPPPQPD